jgi:hypothetical protein
VFNGADQLGSTSVGNTIQGGQNLGLLVEGDDRDGARLGKQPTSAATLSVKRIKRSSSFMAPDLSRTSTIWGLLIVAALSLEFPAAT